MNGSKRKFLTLITNTNLLYLPDAQEKLFNIIKNVMTTVTLAAVF